MYSLPYFKESNKQVILDFIAEHPFAFIAGSDAENKPVASQVPVFIEDRNGKLFMTGHMMRKTDHQLAFENNANVLCVFSGPHVYVSATWYTDPQQASTWNYMSVHVRGIIRFLGEQGLVDVLRKTTLHFENNNPDSATVYDNLAEDYRTRLMKAIIAFEIEVTGIENVFKLSQNRDRESYENIITKLREQGSDGTYIAEQMERRKNELFNS
jgi:transcriptional regulator